MSVVLNHTIVRAADQSVAAQFFAGLLELEVGERAGPFTPVSVNDELTLDFDDRGVVVPSHFGFLVDDTTFDLLLERLRARPEARFGSGPVHGWDRSINHIGGGRGVYVGDPNGHSYEFFTVVPPAG